MKFKYNLKHKSLTMRIWFTFITFTVVIVLALSFFYILFVRSIEKENKKYLLEGIHQTIFDVITDQQSKPNFNNVPRFNNIRHIQHIIAYQNSETKQTTITSLDNHNPASISSSLIVSFLDTLKASGPNSASSFEHSYNHTLYLFTATPLTIRGQIEVYLISYTPYVPRNTYIYFTLIIGIIFILVSLVVSKIVATYISKPLKQLQLQASKIARKEWVSPLAEQGNDEIAQLIHSINHMQESLKRADEEEKEFLQSISHDLKTPIMVILSHAEAINDGMYIDSPKHTVDIIKNEAIRLQKKVQQILYYNTLSYALSSDSTAMDIDLNRLIHYMVNKFSLLNPSLKWELSLQPAIIHASSDHLQVALENILDNQLRYAQTKIGITIYKTDEFVHIDIYNDGPKIPDEDLPQIFQKLYRGKNGKFGLGLSITHKIISFYNGIITTENIHQGVIFKIQLPLPPKEQLI